jgi:hypothetical protein
MIRNFVIRNFVIRNILWLGILWLGTLYLDLFRSLLPTWLDLFLLQCCGSSAFPENSTSRPEASKPSSPDWGMFLNNQTHKWTGCVITWLKKALSLRCPGVRILSSVFYSKKYHPDRWLGDWTKKWIVYHFGSDFDRIWFFTAGVVFSKFFF